MRGRVLSAIAAAGLMAAVSPVRAKAGVWVGLGTGTSGWALYTPTPYAASPIDLSYHIYSGYPDGFFIGGSLGGHASHRWW